MSEEETTDINELFSRDPLSLTNSDIDKIILEMRKKRHTFQVGPAPKSGGTKSLTKAQEQASKLDIDLKL